MEKLGTNSAGKPGTSSALPLDSTFIWRLLSARDAGQLSAAEVQQLVLEMLLAGTDTSSVSLYYLMVELQGNRLLEKDLRDEVLTAAGESLVAVAGSCTRVPLLQLMLAQASVQHHVRSNSQLLEVSVNWATAVSTFSPQLVSPHCLDSRQ